MVCQYFVKNTSYRQVTDVFLFVYLLKNTMYIIKANTIIVSTTKANFSDAPFTHNINIILKDIDKVINSNQKNLVSKDTRFRLLTNPRIFFWGLYK